MKYSNYRFPVPTGNIVVRIAVLVTVLLTVAVQMTMPRPVDAVATTPTTMNFQGRLTNNAGNIMSDGLYNMKFRIYDASTGGTLKWSETRETTNRVQVTNGLFSVAIGQVTPLDPAIFASGSLYFEIELPTPATATCSTAACATFTEGPMTPRNKLSTSAYAYNSETLDGLDSSQFARTDAANTFVGAQIIRADSTNAFTIQNSAGTSNIFNVNTLQNTVSIKSGTDLTTPVDMYTATDFTTNWTTTDWTPTWGDNGALSHTVGNTSPLIYDGFTPTIGNKYLVQFGLDSPCGSVSDTLTVTFGGKTLAVINGKTCSYQYYRFSATATSTAKLTFTPTTNYSGPVYDYNMISIWDYTNVTPVASALTIQNAAGTGNIEMRASNNTDSTYIGLNSGKMNAYGVRNTAVGANALAKSVYAIDNSAFGSTALQNNVAGYGNSAFGSQALRNNTDGVNNAAFGYNSLGSNTIGNSNVSMGNYSLQSLVGGSENTAIGMYAGASGTNASGNMNSFLGSHAGEGDSNRFFFTTDNLQNATAIGAYAQVQSSNSIVLGSVDMGTKVAIGTTIPDSLFSVSPVVYSDGTASQTGTTVTGTGVAWGTGSGAVKVGMKIIYRTGESATITNVANTQLTVDVSQTVSNKVYRIHSTGFQVSASGDAYVKNTSATAFSVQDSAGSSILGVNTSTGKVTMLDAEIGAGKSLTLVGGATRPSPATEGMLFYDTTTKQLLTYSNGKWQQDRTEAILVAASNSSQADKDAADYVGDGNTGAALDGDQVQINNALSAAAGKKVILLAGTYVVDATILVPNSTTLGGVGNGTLVELADLDVAETVIESSDGTTGTGVVIRDMKLDGRNDLNTAGNQYGITMTNMGDTGTSRAGGTVTNVSFARFRREALWIQNSDYTKITNNTVTGGGNGFAIYGTASDYNTVSGNKLVEVIGDTFSLYGNYGTVSDNTVTTSAQNSSSYYLGGSNYTFTGNISKGNLTGLTIDGSYNTVSGNSLIGNGDGIYATGSASTGNVISNNVVQGSTGASPSAGITIYAHSGETVTGNSVTGGAGAGIKLVGSGASFPANNNIVANNTLKDNGGATTNDAIYLGADADNNTISGNSVTDSSATTNNYPLNISSSTDDTNYLSGNTYTSGSIRDIGTGTRYANQLDSSNQLLSGATSIKSSAATAFQIQNTGATETFLGVDATTNRIKIGNSTAAAAGDVTLLVVDSVVSTITPTGVAGAMYYDSTNNKFKCYTTGWVDCDTTSAGGGVTTVGAFTGASIANGASISGNTITLGAADGTNAGLVTTGSQTLAGTKTFSDGLTSGDDIVSSTTGEFRTLSRTIAGNSIDAIFRTGSTTSGNTGNANLLSGNATGGTSGNIVIDSGTATATTGGINLGGTNASAINLGRTAANIATTINGTALVKSAAANSAAAFQVQNATAASLFTVDTSGSKVQIGAAATDATVILLQLDNYNVATDPTGIDGAMYYNSATKNFRCFSSTLWYDCDFSSLRSEWMVQEDFMTTTTAAGTAADLGNIGDRNWTFVSIGTGGTLGKVNVGSVAADQDRMGVLQMNTPATLGTGAHLRLDNASIAGVPSNMTVEFDYGTVNAAAATGQQQILRLGLHNSTSATAPTNGMYFQYSTTTAAGNWFRCTQATCVDTGVAFNTTAGAYTRFKMVTNSAGTAVEFFINESSVGTASANLPGVTAVYGPTMNASTVDATIRQWKMDYFQIKRNLTTLR